MKNKEYKRFFKMNFYEVRRQYLLKTKKIKNDVQTITDLKNFQSYKNDFNMGMYKIYKNNFEKKELEETNFIDFVIHKYNNNIFNLINIIERNILNNVWTKMYQITTYYEIYFLSSYILNHPKNINFLLIQGKKVVILKFVKNQNREAKYFYFLIILTRTHI
jgi:hypothetical protein